MGYRIDVVSYRCVKDEQQRLSVVGDSGWWTRIRLNSIWSFYIRVSNRNKINKKINTIQPEFVQKKKKEMFFPLISVTDMNKE